MLSLTAIHVYPLKSAGGLSLEQVTLDRFGPEGDRRWMLVDDNHRFLSQREDARLARVRPRQLADGLELELDGESIAVETPADARRRDVQIWEDRVPAVDAGDDAARWFTERLERPVRLVYMPDSSHRYVDGMYAAAGETVSFADGFPLLLVSASSLDLLNSKLPEPVSLDRFRPNLIVSGCEPHAEDRWRRVRIGEVELDVVKPCSRCVVPSVDQRSGEKHPEILRVLAAYRRGEDRQVYFGQNLLYRQTGRLKRGDPVEVLS
jgi:uncharacterized protein YcbX